MINPKLSVTEQSWGTVLAEVRRVLPLQNPLRYFLHNNLLMAWERFPFWSGLAKATELYGAKSGALIERHHLARRAGAISAASLRDAVRLCLDGVDDCLGGDGVIPKGAESPVDPMIVDWLASLMEAVPSSPVQAIQKVLGETPSVAAGGGDGWTLDPRTVEWLCLFLESVLDQGLALWRSPGQNAGLLCFFVDWLRHSKVALHGWQGPVTKSILGLDLDGPKYVLDRWRASDLNASEWLNVCLRLLFQVKGWAGMVNKMETEPAAFRLPNQAVKLEDLLSILLLIATGQGVNWRALAAPFGLPPGPLASPCQTGALAEALERHGITSFRGASESLRGRFADVVGSFDTATTEKAWQLASESTLYGGVVAKLRAGWQATPCARDVGPSPEFQVLTCMDDREESLRRHLEGTTSACETFGVLGNFGLDMKFVGMHSTEPRWQCPPVVVPRRVLIEQEAGTNKRATSPKLVRKLVGLHFAASRKAMWGSLSSLTVGPLAGLPLLANVVSPRYAARWHQALDRKVHPESLAFIDRERRYDERYGEVGYTITEQAEIVAALLAGATLGGSRLASLVLVMGHQSTSSNNPFLQAYGCGACSGNSGAPNARIFAAMANDDAVRIELAARGVSIPQHVRFVPAVHDTARDVIRYFDLESSLKTEDDWARLRSAQAALEAALTKNATERCRRFSNAGSPRGPRQARAHVEARALDLSEPRPEYGHARACLAVFGRRALTSSVDLDRRAFLVSYDADADVDGKILTALVHAALPVVANITLDYFFSAVDTDAFGAGSKLPLNVSGLIGVVTGSAGDLRIGLASQMVEIHEPIRGLALIEATTDRIESVIFSHARLRLLITNGWIRIGAICPKSREVQVWTSAGWRPAAFPHSDLLGSSSSLGATAAS